MIENLYPVILSGGSGTRLWPISTPETPKQFLPLFGSKTLFQMTFERSLIFNDNTPLIVTNYQHLSLVKDQIGENHNYDILIEPIGRDTAPAITLALLHIKKQNPEAILLVMPADHYIPNHPEFRSMVLDAIDGCKDNIITFGIRPTYPETGYGYIELSEVKISDKCHKVKQFREKPNLEKANEFILKGNCYWNSGIFLFSIPLFYHELNLYSPELVQTCSLSLQTHRMNDSNIIQVDPIVFETLKPISIDYALMEKSDKIGILPTSVVWSDVGSWLSLWQIKDKDENLNVIENTSDNVICNDVTNSYIINKSLNHKMIVIGIKDCIIVNTDSTILVVDKNSTQKIKSIVK
jgi:mannose-1-phosphate guanylyltransferase